METILGTEFLDNSNKGEKIPSSNQINLLYFSASWCPPCIQLTEKLIDIYEKLNCEKQIFEVIYISSDHNQEDFEKYYSIMPWIAISYEKQQRIKRIIDYYNIRSIPILMLIDDQGNSLSSACRRDIERLGINAINFWTNYFSSQLNRY